MHSMLRRRMRRAQQCTICTLNLSCSTSAFSSLPKARSPLTPHHYHRRCWQHHDAVLCSVRNACRGFRAAVQRPQPPTSRSDSSGRAETGRQQQQAVQGSRGTAIGCAGGECRCRGPKCAAAELFVAPAACPPLVPTPAAHACTCCLPSPVSACRSSPPYRVMRQTRRPQICLLTCSRSGSSTWWVLAAYRRQPPPLPPVSSSGAVD